MGDESALVRAVMGLIEGVAPDHQSVANDVSDYRRSKSAVDRDKTASDWADRACWLYASAGAASALPGAIPGLGTASQIAIEGGAITADLMLMLRTMQRMVMGIAVIYGRDVETDFNEHFLKVLGIWSGPLTLTKGAAQRVGAKVAVVQFDRRVSGEVFKRINARVGTTIVTKYGTKRGGIAVGRLIPFGVGAAIGGGFNLATMKAFKAAAISYFKSDGPVYEAA